MRLAPIAPHLLVTLLGIATASTAWAAPTVTAPAGGTTDDALKVFATVTSSVSISQVTASAPPASTTLSGSSGTYSGTLDLSAVPIGPFTLTITAKDVLGATGSTTVSYTHDHAPKLTVGTLQHTVARPNIHLVASCSDTDAYGCASITVRSNDASKILASTTGGPLDSTVSLAEYEGHSSSPDQGFDLLFTATDTLGLTDTKLVRVYVDSSPQLIEQETVDGLILDFDATRILHATSTALYIYDRGSKADTKIAAIGPYTSPFGTVSPPEQYVSQILPSHSFLTKKGAIWPGGEYRTGVLTAASMPRLLAAGDYACWSDDSTTGTGSGGYEDLATGIKSSVSGPYIYCSSVAANGDAIYEVGNTLRRYRGGVLSASLSTNSAINGFTDGINIIFAVKSFSSNRNSIRFITSTGTDTEIEPPYSSSTVILSYPTEDDMRVSGGWAAFTTHDLASDTLQVKRRSLTGAFDIASIFTTSARINALEDSGRVVWAAGGKRYLSKVGTLAPDLVQQTDLGKIQFQGGEVYAKIGRKLLHYVPSAGDAGVSDASDADVTEAAVDASDDAVATDTSVADVGVDSSVVADDGITPDAPTSDAPGDDVLAAAAPPAADTSSGCAVTSRGGGRSWAFGLVFAALAASRRRRKRMAFCISSDPAK